jgi:hypothetical protein
LYIIQAFVVLLFDSFILVTTDITSSCLGSNNGELNTVPVLAVYIYCALQWCRFGLVMLFT